MPKSLGPDALLRAKVKQKRFRDGYEEGLSTTHRATSAAAFVLSEAPVEMLGQYSRRASHAVHGRSIYKGRATSAHMTLPCCLPPRAPLYYAGLSCCMCSVSPT